MKTKNFFSSLKWIYFISERFSKVDRKGRSAVTSTLSSLGVCFGVMALIVVISVMNGFQLEFIDAIIEVSSYHVRVRDFRNEDEEKEFLKWCSNQKEILSFGEFYEAQGLMAGTSGRESASLVRGVDSDICEKDSGFSREIKIRTGEFDLSEDGSIILGASLAKNIGAKVGSTVSLLALSGSKDVELFSAEREFVVKGIFNTGYADINSAYSFINLNDAKKYFGSGSKKNYGIKIRNSNRESPLIAAAENNFPGINIESWRSYNRSFFGALRIEKNMLMLLVFLIFVVVAVNIYNGMRKMVYERREEIAVLSALGAGKKDVQFVFIVKGLVTGLKGAIPGLVLGIFICVNMENVFMLLSHSQYFFQYFIAVLFDPEKVYSLQENSMFRAYANIPARMLFPEIASIFFFGVFSSLAASWIASRHILNVTVAEVLHDD